MKACVSWAPGTGRGGGGAAWSRAFLANTSVSASVKVPVDVALMRAAPDRLTATTAFLKSSALLTSFGFSGIWQNFGGVPDFARDPMMSAGSAPACATPAPLRSNPQTPLSNATQKVEKCGANGFISWRVIG